MIDPIVTPMSDAPTAHPTLDPTAGTGTFVYAIATTVNDDVCIDQPFDEFGFANFA